MTVPVGLSDLPGPENGGLAYRQAPCGSGPARLSYLPAQGTTAAVRPARTRELLQLSDLPAPGNYCSCPTCPHQGTTAAVRPARTRELQHGPHQGTIVAVRPARTRELQRGPQSQAKSVTMEFKSPNNPTYVEQTIKTACLFHRNTVGNMPLSNRKP